MDANYGELSMNRGACPGWETVAQFMTFCGWMPGDSRGVSDELFVDCSPLFRVNLSQFLWMVR